MGGEGEQHPHVGRFRLPTVYEPDICNLYKERYDYKGHEACTCMHMHK